MPHTDIEDVFEFGFIRNNWMENLCPICGAHRGLSYFSFAPEIRISALGRLGLKEISFPIVPVYTPNMQESNFVDNVRTFHEVYNDERNPICSACFSKLLAEQGGLCRYCGVDDELLRIYKIKRVDGTFIYALLCDRCGNSSDVLATCAVCGDTVWARNGDRVSGTGFMCVQCQRDSAYCRHCGSRMPKENLIQNPVSEQGDRICMECLKSEYINPYNWIPNFYKFFHKKEETCKRYIGVEIELEAPVSKEWYKFPEQRALALKAFSALPVFATNWSRQLFIKHDGSLDCGFELVSHPMSMEYHKEFDWEAVFATVKEYGLISKPTCGLHFHVSRRAFGSTEEKQDYNIAKLCLIVDLLWGWLALFVNRDLDKAMHYAAPYGIDVQDTARTTLYKAKGDNIKYRAVNLLHDRTVEIRLFQGVDTAENFRRQLELVDCLITLALRYPFKQLKRINPVWIEVVAANKGYTKLVTAINECNINFPAHLPSRIEEKIRRAVLRHQSAPRNTLRSTLLGSFISRR